MDRRDTPREVLVPVARDGKARLDDHVPEALLAGEALDALDEVLVRVPVAGDDLADEGDAAEGPALVEGVEDGILHGAELEAGEDAAGLEDAARLAEGGGYVCEVADAEGDGVEVDRVVRDGGGEGGGVGLEEGEGGLVGGGEGLGAGAADGEHGGVDVRDCEVDRRVRVGVDGVAEEAEGDVAGATGNVEDAEVQGRVGGDEARGERGDELVPGGFLLVPRPAWP